jgi:hypothetical protein
VAHCNNLLCSIAANFTLDNTGDVGQWASITLGADGLGLISYYDVTNSALKVAHCDNTLCSSATTYTLDNTAAVGLYTSITVGADGLGLVSYHNGTPNRDLKVAHCNNQLCSSATTYTLDSAGDVGRETSISVGADERGLISYSGNIWADLKVAHCDDLLCSSATISTLDSGSGFGYSHSSTAGSDGLGLVSYYGDYDLSVARCDNLLCSSATPYILDSDEDGDVGDYPSITVGSDGLGLISYFYEDDDYYGYLKVAHCDNLLCSSATTAILDPTYKVFLPLVMKSLP